jgi:D-serine deaminase-like pyridoxal phosphate-dependent protein
MLIPEVRQRADGGGAPDPAAFPIGALVQIVPNHSCLTAACHSVYYLLHHGRVVGEAAPCRGW